MKELCYLGEPALRKKCKEVKEITPFIHKVIEEMIEVADSHYAAGLAASQIGYELRIFLNYYSKKVDSTGFALILNEPEIYINPKITKFSKQKVIETEACLSIPGVREELERAYQIDIEFTNLDGKRIYHKEKNWRAQCLQHELDHLNGVLFIDHLSKEQLEKIQPTLIALEKRTKDRKNSSVMPKDIFE